MSKVLAASWQTKIQNQDHLQGKIYDYYTWNRIYFIYVFLQKQSIATFECRGVDIVDFEPRDGWQCQGIDSKTKFTDIDLSDDFCDYGKPYFGGGVFVSRQKNPCLQFAKIRRRKR
jgi:rubredoxin